MTLMLGCLWNFLLLGSTVQIGEAEPAFHYLWLEKLSFWPSTPTVKIKWRWMSLILNLQPMQWKHSDSILRLSFVYLSHCVFIIAIIAALLLIIMKIITIVRKLWARSWGSVQTEIPTGIGFVRALGGKRHSTWCSWQWLRSSIC